MASLLVVVLIVAKYACEIAVHGKVRDVTLRYHWRKGINYTAGILGLFIIGRLWFASLGSVAIFLGLLGAGIAIALPDPLVNLAAWIFILWRTRATGDGPRRYWARLWQGTRT